MVPKSRKYIIIIIIIIMTKLEGKRVRRACLVQTNFFFLYLCIFLIFVKQRLKIIALPEILDVIFIVLTEFRYH